VDETDQFEDNRTKVVASRCAKPTMMKGSVYFTTSITFIHSWNRIVELRRPGSFVDTSLLGRIHSVADSFIDGEYAT
jgi:hypothetical protein